MAIAQLVRSPLLYMSYDILSGVIPAPSLALFRRFPTSSSIAARRSPAFSFFYNSILVSLTVSCHTLEKIHTMLAEACNHIKLRSPEYSKIVHCNAMNTITVNISKRLLDLINSPYSLTVELSIKFAIHGQLLQPSVLAYASNCEEKHLQSRCCLDLAAVLLIRFSACPVSKFIAGAVRVFVLFRLRVDRTVRFFPEQLSSRPCRVSCRLASGHIYDHRRVARRIGPPHSAVLECEADPLYVYSCVLSCY